jgi:large conductance mechanosensitive channel
MKLLDDFKVFLLRGNVVDLAVAVVMGVAFTAVVTALVEDLMTPLIGALGGNRDFSTLDFSLNGSTFRYGDFINKLVSFVSIAAVVFFFVVTPMNHLISRMRREPSTDPTTRKCPECVSEIPIEAKRCAFCTSQVAVA